MIQSDIENTIDIGKLGENIACRFLEEKGFKIAKRNYRKRWGEVDIIAEINERRGNNLLTKISSISYKITYFVEVKAVRSDLAVTHETENKFNPLDNMHPRKIERLKRTIESYLSENVTHETGGAFFADHGLNWKFGVIAIWVDVNNKKASVQFIEDIAL